GEGRQRLPRERIVAPARSICSFAKGHRLASKGHRRRAAGQESDGGCRNQPGVRILGAEIALSLSAQTDHAKGSTKCAALNDIRSADGELATDRQRKRIGCTAIEERNRAVLGEGFQRYVYSGNRIDLRGLEREIAYRDQFACDRCAGWCRRRGVQRHVSN